MTSPIRLGRISHTRRRSLISRIAVSQLSRPPRAYSSASPAIEEAAASSLSVMTGHRTPVLIPQLPELRDYRRIARHTDAKAYLGLLPMRPDDQRHARGLRDP